MAEIQASDYYGAQGVNVTGNKTLALADCGVIQNVTADAITLTLPASAAGLTYTVRNGGALGNASAAAGSAGDNSVLVSIAPNGTDTVGGNGFTPAAGKGAQNVKLTSRVGDLITLTAGAAGTWVITSVIGTWTRTP